MVATLQSVGVQLAFKKACEFEFTWPVGLMDKASASGAGDSRFESWAGHFFLLKYKVQSGPGPA